jgi:hypothetical protein
VGEWSFDKAGAAPVAVREVARAWAIFGWDVGPGILRTGGKGGIPVIEVAVVGRGRRRRDVRRRCGGGISFLCERARGGKVNGSSG